jgi:hypothetical protein
MEAIGKIALRQSQVSPIEPESTTTFTGPEEAARRRVLAKILYDDRVARQLDPRPAAETDRYVNAFLPLTHSIPAKELYPCYVLAMEMRPAGDNYPVKGIELVQAWKERQGSLEMESLDASRLLPEHAATACGRCYKRRDPQTGVILECLEINPSDGSIGGPCDHRPLTEEEKREASEMRAQFLADAQRKAREGVAARRQAELKAKEEEAKPKDHHLFCSGCHRRVSSLAGWTEGETCRDFLKEQSAICPKCNQPCGVQSLGKMVCRDCFNSFEMIFCDGVMEKFESVREEVR